MKGYWNRPDATAEAITRRLVPHRRHGQGRRGRLLLHRRPQEGHDHPRRLQRLPARDRGGALRAPGRARGGGRRRARTTTWARRSAPPSCSRTARRSTADELRDVRQGARRGLQVPAPRSGSSTSCPRARPARSSSARSRSRSRSRRRSSASASAILGLVRVWMAACALVLLVLGCGSGDGNAAPTRTARPEAPAGEQREADRHPGGAAGRAAARIGNFDQPLYVTAPPGDARRLFVVEQAGRIRVVRNGQTLAEPFLDSARQVTSRRRAGPAAARVRARLRDQRPLLRRLHRPRRRHARSSSTTRASDGTRRPRHRARGCLQRPARAPTTTAASSRSGPTACSTSASATAAAAATSTANAATARTSARCSARSCASTRRPTRRPALHDPARQPVRRTRRRRGRDLGLRPAQPVALLVRPRDRRPLRSATSARTTARRSTSRARGRAQGVNFGWRVVGGHARATTRPSARRARSRPVLEYAHDGGSCSITGGYVVRDPRLPASTAATSTATTAAAQILLSARWLPRGATRACARLGLQCPTLSSFGEDAAGRVYATSLDGPVYRLDPRWMRRAGATSTSRCVRAPTTRARSR